MQSRLILIVEDEPQIADILEAYLRREGFRTARACDGDAAITRHRTLRPDLVLLDFRLPRRNGQEVLAEIRRDADTPVIVATALGEDAEKLAALMVGADDYVVKPFNPLEVVARVKAVLRRTEGSSSGSPLLRVGPLEIDTARHAVRLAGSADAPLLDVTLTEFRILAHMARSPQRVFTRAELLEACLPPDGDALERTVDSHVSKIRRKLEPYGVEGLLEGVRGVGYRLLALR